MWHLSEEPVEINSVSYLPSELYLDDTAVITLPMMQRVETQISICRLRFQREPPGGCRPDHLFL